VDRPSVKLVRQQERVFSLVLQQGFLPIVLPSDIPWLGVNWCSASRNNKKVVIRRQ